MSNSIYTILQPIFGDEIYPIIFKGDVNNPPNLYAVFTQVGGTSFNTLKNTDDLTRQRMQVSIYGTVYNDVNQKYLM